MIVRKAGVVHLEGREPKVRGHARALKKTQRWEQRAILAEWEARFLQARVVRCLFVQLACPHHVAFQTSFTAKESQQASAGHVTIDAAKTQRIQKLGTLLQTYKPTKYPHV